MKRWIACTAAALALGGCVMVPYDGYDTYDAYGPYRAYDYGPYYYYYDNLYAPALSLGYFRYDAGGRHEWRPGPRPPSRQDDRPQVRGPGDRPDRGPGPGRGDYRGGSPGGGRSEAWGQGGRTPDPSVGP